MRVPASARAYKWRVAAAYPLSCSASKNLADMQASHTCRHHVVVVLHAAARRVPVVYTPPVAIDASMPPAICSSDTLFLLRLSHKRPRHPDTTDVASRERDIIAILRLPAAHALHVLLYTCFTRPPHPLVPILSRTPPEAVPLCVQRRSAQRRAQRFESMRSAGVRCAAAVRQ